MQIPKPEKTGCLLDEELGSWEWVGHDQKQTQTQTVQNLGSVDSTQLVLLHWLDWTVTADLRQERISGQEGRIGEVQVTSPMKATKSTGCANSEPCRSTHVMKGHSPPPPDFPLERVLNGENFLWEFLPQVCTSNRLNWNPQYMHCLNSLTQ